MGTIGDRCNRCGSYILSRIPCGCRCYQVAIREWNVTYDWKDGRRVPGSGRLEYEEVWASTPEMAATKYVERCDASECDVLESDVHAIVIHDDWTMEFFRVRAQATVEYWSEPADPDEGPEVEL